MGLLRNLIPTFGFLILISPLAAIPTKAAQDDLINAAAAGDLSRIKALLASKANVNASIANGATALIMASQEGHVDVVRALLSANADVNAKTNKRVTALILASGQGHLNVVEALLTAKADVNARADNGVTALYLASQKGRVKVVKVLLDAGADANIRAEDGRTALIEAALTGQAEIIGALLEAKADVNASAADGATALALASQIGRADVVVHLLAANADVNAARADGATALMLASYQGHLRVVEALLSANVDVNAKAANGYTALVRAAQRGQVVVVEALLAAGADASFAANDGETAISLATRGGFTETIRILKNLRSKNSREKIGNLVTERNGDTLLIEDGWYYSKFMDFTAEKEHISCKLNIDRITGDIVYVSDSDMITIMSLMGSIVPMKGKGGTIFSIADSSDKEAKTEQHMLDQLGVKRGSIPDFDPRKQSGGFLTMADAVGCVWRFRNPIEFQIGGAHISARKDATVTFGRDVITAEGLTITP